MAKPTLADLTMAKHVLRYLKGTVHEELTFKKSSDPMMTLTGFCDADWGSSEDRHSITGYGFRLADNGPLISWKSKKQQTVALSTCEAEYMSLAAATQEGKFLMQLLRDMTNLNTFVCFTMYCDNQGAIALAKNPVQHQRSKHIDIRYHFVRSEIQTGVLELVYVPSEQNVADVFTKPVTRFRLKNLINVS